MREDPLGSDISNDRLASRAFLYASGELEGPELDAFEHRLAADQGHPDAQYNIGTMYQDGRGLAQDYVQALTWYRRAAEKGFATAQNMIGVMYSNSLGVGQDHREALKWFRLAAEQGYAFAQSRLGSLYVEGKGVPQDKLKGYFWLTLATKEHRRIAERQRAQLIPKLTFDEITKAEVDAAHWHAKEAIPVTGNTIR